MTGRPNYGTLRDRTACKLILTGGFPQTSRAARRDQCLVIALTG